MVVGLPDSDGRLKKERSAGSNLRTMSPPIQRAADGKPQRRRGKKHLALPAPGPQQGEPARLVPVGEVQRDSPPLKDPEALSLTVYVGAPASRRKGKRSAKALDLEETPTKKQRPEEGPGQTSAVPQQPLDLPTGYVPNVVIVHPPGHDNQQQLEVRGRKQKKRKAAAEAKTLTETDYPPPPKIVFFEPVLNTVEPSSEPEKAIQNPFDGSGTHLGKPAPEFPGFKAGEQGVPTVSGDSLNTSNLSSVVAKCKGCHHVFWGQKIRKIRKRHRCPPARPDSAKPREALRTSPEPKAQGSLPVLEGDQTAPEAAPQAKAGPEEVLGDDSQQHPLSGAAGQRGTPVPHSDNPAHPAEAGPDVDMRTLPVDDRNSSQSHREPLPDTQGRDSFDRLIDMMIALSEKVQTMSNQLEEVRRSVSAGEREVAKPATENLGAIPDIPTASEAASAAQSPSLPPTKGVDSGHKTKGKKPKQKKKKKKPKPRASPSPSTATAPAAPAVPTSTPKPSGEASPPAVALVPKSPGPRPKGRAAWGELGPRDKSQAVTRKAGAAKPPTFAASSSEDASAPTKASKDPSAAPAKSDSSAISHGGQAKLPKGHRCTFCSRLFRSRKEVEDHAKRKNGCANRDAQREDQLRDRKADGLFNTGGLRSAALSNDSPHWKQVRELLTLWRRGDWTKLHLRALAAINKMNSRVRENKARVDDRYGSADTLARTRRCIKFGELAELSRAAEALIAADLAPTTDETRKSLEEKHPRPTVPFTAEDGSCTLPHPEKPTKWVLKQEVLARALRESPRGSAGGPTGWRMDFLRELFTHPGDLKLLGAWLQAAARGDVGQGVAQWWTSSSLVALEKPGGGVRPIAVGEVFPRLLARCLAVDYHDAIIRHLKPKGQFGAGARNGAETVIHGVRAACIEGLTLRGPISREDS
ncbi:unnamed protein product [Closterium sp. NIES-65]|nr:unnamed protein product [Closterium sp. NIES-65]